MSSGTFSRVKTWTSTEDVTNSDLNAEFDNILNNLNPEGMGAYSDNVTEMQTTFNHGDVGSENLPQSLADELAALRFALTSIKGTTYWYSSADSSIAELASSLGGGLPRNRIGSGASSSNSSQPIFLDPEGSAATINLRGNSTNFIYYIEGQQYTISSDINVTSLQTAPSSNNTCLVNDTQLADQDYTKTLGEFNTRIFIDNIGSEISTLTGTRAAFSINNGVDTEYFTADIGTTNLLNARRGMMFDSSQANVPAIAFSNNDTITLLKLTWLFANTAGALEVTYNEPFVQTDQPSSPANGDFWFDLDPAEDKWKKFNGTTWDDADATFIGICMQDSSNCVAARSADFFKDHSSFNSIRLKSESATQITSFDRGEIKVYGQTLRYDIDFPFWDITTDLVSGVSETASTLYFLYIDETGDTWMDTAHPKDRVGDLKGLYHPAETWRCVGAAYNDPSSDLSFSIDFSDLSENNYVITAESSGTTLTVSLYTNPLVRFKFKHDTQRDGDFLYCQIAQGQTLDITSGATMGHRDATNEPIYPHILYNNRNPILALSTNAMIEGQLVSASAMSSSADDEDLYAYAATSSLPNKRFGYIISNQTTAGSWSSAVAEINNYGRGFIRVLETSSSGAFSTSSSSFVDVSNQSLTNVSSGRKLKVELSTNAGGGLGITEGGSGAGNVQFQFDRNNSSIRRGRINLSNATSLTIEMPFDFSVIDTTAAQGTSYTYKLQARDTDAETATATNVTMRIWEMIDE